MANRVLFIGWNRAIPGREQQALEVFQQAQDFFGKLKSENRIESFDTVLLQAHGGDLNGFVMAKSTSDGIQKIREDDAYLNLIMRMGMCVEGVGTLIGFTDDGITEMMTRYARLASGK